MQLDPLAFNSHLAGMGQDVTWRRSHACPCVNPNSGQAKAMCPHCAGKGRIWEAGVDARTGVAGGEVVKRWMQSGIADMGDIIVSIPSNSRLYGIGPLDRVLFRNRTEPFSQNIVKGVQERIRFFVVSVEKVLYLNGAGELVDAPLPEVKTDGTLDWNGAELPDGVTFSVTGRRKAEYYCFPESFFDRPHHAGAPLPRRVVLRRFDLYGNQ